MARSITLKIILVYHPWGGTCCILVSKVGFSMVIPYYPIVENVLKGEVSLLTSSMLEKAIIVKFHLVFMQL
jgi:hypothetical protein